jgi:pimeloyl-ACP methyl ester carboxylesterase
MPMIELPSGRFHYDEFGSGPPVLWVSGGGAVGAIWHPYQMPYFERFYRNVTYDNRGIGETVCDEPRPWTIADMARDAAALIEALFEPPIVVAGKSMGGFIVLQLVLDRPDLCKAAIAMGVAPCGHEGWLGDYMRAEVELRRAGGRLDGMFSVIHYAAQLYPARALGDSATWAEIRKVLGEGDFNEQNEHSLIPQWQACIDFDVRDRLPECTVPLHVIGFGEDVQAPPQLAEEVARLAPTAEFHLLDGMGHGSLWGHTQAEGNPFIKGLIDRYVS